MLRFMADLDARKLHPATVRKYCLLQKQMKVFVAHIGLGFLSQLDTAMAMMTGRGSGGGAGRLFILKGVENMFFDVSPEML
jgi:hypothetical protein